MIYITNNIDRVECLHVGWRADTERARQVSWLPDGAAGRGLAPALRQSARARGLAPEALRRDDDARGASLDEPAPAARKARNRPQLDGRGDRRARSTRLGRTPPRPCRSAGGGGGSPPPRRRDA